MCSNFSIQPKDSTLPVSIFHFNCNILLTLRMIGSSFSHSMAYLWNTMEYQLKSSKFFAYGISRQFQSIAIEMKKILCLWYFQIISMNPWNIYTNRCFGRFLQPSSVSNFNFVRKIYQELKCYISKCFLLGFQVFLGIVITVLLNFFVLFKNLPSSAPILFSEKMNRFRNDFSFPKSKINDFIMN